MKKSMFLAVFAVAAILIAYSAGAQTLSRVDPGRGQPGARVNAEGRNLDRCGTGSVLTIYFPDQNVYLDFIPGEWSSSTIIGYIPGLEATGWTREQKQYFYNHATNGEVKITNVEDSRRVDCGRSSASTFKFIPPAPQWFFTNAAGDFRRGETFRIEGSGFGEVPGKVVYPKLVAGELTNGEFPIESWTVNVITVRIPRDIPTDVIQNVWVMRNDGDGVYTASSVREMGFKPLEITPPYRPELKPMTPRKIRPHPGGAEPVKPEL